MKNYYVRQQCSRFIKRGYDIITSLCPQSLAAVNPTRDTLVLVALNEGAAAAHVIDLSLFSELPARSQIRAYRTSAGENLASVSSSVKLEGSILTLSMPAQSITTLVIPARSVQAGIGDLLVDGCEYLIVPRQETTRAVSATGSKVTIEDIDYGPSQRWRLAVESGGTCRFQNALGLRLTAHRASNSSSLTAQSSTAGEQGFYIDEVDYPYFKILASRGRSHGFDLTQESSSAGTVVNIWQYEGSNTTPTHRQWMLFPLTTAAMADGLGPSHAVAVVPATTAAPAVYDLSGRRVATGSNSQAGLSKGIYIVSGKKTVIR